MTGGYLVFHLMERLFGVKLAGALEIMPWRQGRRVPLAYSYVEGLIDYRRTIYPVFNLAQRLALKGRGPIGFTADETPSPLSGRSIVLLEESKRPFGISVDRIVKMTNIQELTPAPPEARDPDASLIKGLAYENNQEIVILDFERLFFHGC
jgi:chemotaxis signal transduction protein